MVGNVSLEVAVPGAHYCMRDAAPLAMSRQIGPLVSNEANGSFKSVKDVTGGMASKLFTIHVRVLLVDIPLIYT